jgi:hypothetical protein
MLRIPPKLQDMVFSVELRGSKKRRKALMARLTAESNSILQELRRPTIRLERRNCRNTRHEDVPRGTV